MSGSPIEGKFPAIAPVNDEVGTAFHWSIENCTIAVAWALVSWPRSPRSVYTGA